MSPGLTTERIYNVLKRQIVMGERPAGDRLDPARLAVELNASATPVRDALHQLLGERMVHAFPQQGFQIPVLSETGLRELYGWNSDILSILLRSWRASTGAAQVLDHDIGDVAEATSGLFDAIATALGTGEHRRAVRHVNDRLHHVRLVEAITLPDVEGEVSKLIEAWTSRSAADLRAGLVRYHRRRLHVVSILVAHTLEHKT